EGEIDLGMANGLSLYLAYEGKDIWEGNPQKNLRAITRTHAATIHYVVNKASGIKTFADLIGTRGNTDVVGGTPRLIHADICRYAGVDINKMAQTNVNYVQALDLFRDGHIDWFLASGSVPEANVTEIAFSRDIDLLEIGGELRERMLAEIPYYFGRTIPAGTYNGVDRDIETIDTLVAIWCDVSMPDDIVYELTKAIHEGIDEVRKLHVGLSDLSIDNAAGGLGIPLHPGAERYYQEAKGK
ncbi:TAXI family TRAP transporter solute-binding subunit, partial [bacterium]|nr:TAXI family TRAP transporter solute-binding subunit [bacterium]